VRVTNTNIYSSIYKLYTDYTTLGLGLYFIREQRIKVFLDYF